MGEEGERSRRNREDKRQLSERHAPPEAALTTRPAASALQALLAQADPAAPRGDSQGMSLKDDASCGTSTFFSFGGGEGKHKWRTPRTAAKVQPPPESGAPLPDLSSGLAGIAKLVPHATNLMTLHRRDTEAGAGPHVQITLWGRLPPPDWRARRAGPHS